MPRNAHSATPARAGIFMLRACAPKARDDVALGTLKMFITSGFCAGSHKSFSVNFISMLFAFLSWAIRGRSVRASLQKCFQSASAAHDEERANMLLTICAATADYIRQAISMPVFTPRPASHWSPAWRAGGESAELHRERCACWRRCRGAA